MRKTKKPEKTVVKGGFFALIGEIIASPYKTDSCYDQNLHEVTSPEEYENRALERYLKFEFPIGNS